MQKSQRRIAYEKYIASPEWKAKRLERIKIDNGECRGCGSKENLEVHHKYPSGYKDIPNESVIDDLTTLCNDCHTAIHSSINKKRYDNRDIEVPNYQGNSPKGELQNYGVANSTVPTNRSKPDDPAQWGYGQSYESNSKTNEVSIWKTNQNRGRSRGNS